jgi:hypothetical protein
MLIATLTKSTAVQLLKSEPEKLGDLKLMLNEVSMGLTVSKAAAAPKISRLKKTLGEETLLKILCVAIYSFCDSIKAKKSMDSADIIECSEMIIEKYPVESLKDIIMALKMAKVKGMNFYNSISTPVIFEIITDYMDKKASYLEQEWLDQKSKTDGSVNTEAHSRSIEWERRQDKIDKRNEQKELQEVQKVEREIKKTEDEIKKLLDK